MRAPNNVKECWRGGRRPEGVPEDRSHGQWIPLSPAGSKVHESVLALSPGPGVEFCSTGRCHTAYVKLWQVAIGGQGG